MAHDGTGVGWDTTAPGNSDPIKDGAKEVRDLRLGMGFRLDKEHAALATKAAALASGTDGGGEHKAGSAKAYYATSAPTNRPDAATALTSNDYGRMYYCSTDSKFYVYTATGFVQVVGSIPNGTVTAVMLATDAVETLKIKDLNVTTGKLAAALNLSAKTLTLPTSQTIVTPTIASFLNATHDHADDAGGGVLSILDYNYGTYTGDATTRNITTGELGALTFDPKVVLIVAQSQDYAELKIATMATSYASRLTTGSYGADKITLATNKFTVYNTATNSSGIVYHWFALG